MKKIFKKNQLVITALALMIAVAGYFSYMNNNIDDPAAKETSADAGTSADLLEEDYEISDEDSMVGEIFTDEGTGEELAVVDGTETVALDESADTLEDGTVADGTDTMSDTVADAETAAGEDVA
ncbi:MAG: SpoIIIAH-like family protein, partial [Roseburia sp.]|nr:SpoIIIAH-like family protein [Roseburia sp.]